MKKFNTLYELLKFPLKLLLLGYIFVGLHSFLLGTNFSILYTVSTPLFITILELLSKIGKFIIVNAPLILVIKLVSRKTNSYVPIYSAIIGYGVYLVCTALFSNNQLPALAYSNIFNIEYKVVDSANIVSYLYPIQTGFIAAIVVGIATRQTYKQSRKSNINIVNFIDKDILAIIYNIIYCIVLGILVTILWPYIYEWYEQLIHFISKDISNPVSLFVYGVIERIFNLLNISNLIRDPFWFTSVGGSWLTVANESITGDVNVYSAMLRSGFDTLSFGKFITPYYIINIFIYPSIIMAFFTLHTNNIEKIKFIPTVIVSIILSILTGSLIPLDITLFLLCPLLYFTHVILTGSLFALLQFFNIQLGFSYTGDSLYALPGTLFDFGIHFRNPLIYDNLINIILIGIIYALIYYFLVIVYYRYLAIDIFQTGEMKRLMKKLENSIGGFNNIKSVEATPFKLVIQIHDSTNVNRNELFNVGTDRISESKNHFTFMLGKKSYMFYRNIKYIIKQNNN